MSKHIQRFVVAKVAVTIAIVLTTIGCSIGTTEYLVRIENISQDSTLISPFSPGVYAVHDNSVALFFENEEQFGNGLESLAEDGNPAELATNIDGAPGISQSGVFAIPVGAESHGVLPPDGSSYEFTITANSNTDRLSFALMLVESNDLFFAPDDTGIRLFRFGGSVEGDITSSIKLWDAKTEKNEMPGSGVYQPLRQLGGDTGPSELGPVQEVNDGFAYPRVDQMIRVTITPQ